MKGLGSLVSLSDFLFSWTNTDVGFCRFWSRYFGVLNTMANCRQNVYSVTDVVVLLMSPVLL